MDILGNALLDFFNNEYTEDIMAVSNISEADTMPLPGFIDRQVEHVAFAGADG